MAGSLAVGIMAVAILAALCNPDAIRHMLGGAMTKTTRVASADRRAVRDYLDALGARPSRRRSPERLRVQLDRAQGQLANETSSLARLELVQRCADLRAALTSAEQGEDTDVTMRFVESARRYGDACGISYGAWREVGVPAAVLRQAGIAPSRR